jgi:hypothetical protein
VPAAYWKIVIEQGATWRTVLTLMDPDGVIDLSGHTARMQIRENIESPAPLYALSTSPGGGITVDGPAGKITLVISDSVSTAWEWRYGVYDLELIDGDGDVQRILKGEVEVDREVTR